MPKQTKSNGKSNARATMMKNALALMLANPPVKVRTSVHANPSSGCGWRGSSCGRYPSRRERSSEAKMRLAATDGASDCFARR